MTYSISRVIINARHQGPCRAALMQRPEGVTVRYKTKPRLPIIPIGPSIAYVPLGKDRFSLIDRESVNIASPYKWYAHQPKGSRSEYACTGVPQPMLLHRLILGLSPGDGVLVDHRMAGETLNNMRFNLRRATPTQNSRNLRKQMGTSSHYKGITWNARKGKWQAQIKVDRKSYYLGLFTDPAEAHAAYCSASVRLHGEFGCTA